MVIKSTMVRQTMDIDDGEGGALHTNTRQQTPMLIIDRASMSMNQLPAFVYAASLSRVVLTFM